jgi:hypothetical protein
MVELFRINWQALSIPATIKVSLALLIMMVLTHLTGETWLATAFAAMCAWLANTPGPLKARVGGMLLVAAASIALTLLSGWIALELWPNIVLIAGVTFLGTMGLAFGARGFMIGFSVICWAIYGPFLVAATSVENCIWAITLGAGVVIVLNVIGDTVFGDRGGAEIADMTETTGDPADDPDLRYVVSYAVTVAVVLSITTYYGWVQLKIDPTLMVGGAYFIFGFDVRKTWVMGFGRVMGLVAGVLVGLVAAKLVGPGLVLDAIMIVACGLSFGAFEMHPGAWMFFFMVFVAAGWPALDPEVYDLTMLERFYGEIVGIVVAMLGIAFLQWLQTRFWPMAKAER